MTDETVSNEDKLAYAEQVKAWLEENEEAIAQRGPITVPPPYPPRPE